MNEDTMTEDVEKTTKITNPRVVHDMVVEIQENIVKTVELLNKIINDTTDDAVTPEAIEVARELEYRIMAPSKSTGKPMPSEGLDLVVKTSGATK